MLIVQKSWKPLTLGSPKGLSRPVQEYGTADGLIRPLATHCYWWTNQSTFSPLEWGSNKVVLPFCTQLFINLFFAVLMALTGQSDKWSSVSWFLISLVLVEYRLFTKPVPTQNNESTKNAYRPYTSCRFREQNSNPRLEYTIGRREDIHQTSAFTEIGIFSRSWLECSM